MSRWVAVLVAASVLVPSAAHAQLEAFNRGNALYQEADFAGAVAAYEEVRSAGFESAELYYNLGNAYFRTGSLGQAILQYERALRLSPKDDDTLENLRLARTRLADRIEPLPRFWLLRLVDRWMTLLPPGVLWALTAGTYLLTGAAVVMLILRRPRGLRAPLKATLWPLALLASLLALTSVVRELELGRPIEAVVLVPEVQVLSAPSAEGGLTVFSIHEGTKVRIDQRTEGWVEVVLEDGKVGWLPTESVEEI